MDIEIIASEIADAATLFNRIVDGGLSLEELTVDELKTKIEKQYHIALEEVEETEKALVDVDIIETFDGAVDSLYTVEPLLDMLDIYCDGVGITSLDDLDNHFELPLSELLSRYRELNLEDLDLETLYKAADLIIENNQQKFTTDVEVFSTWKSAYNRTSVIIDGVEYYFLKDNNNKVKKRDGFVNVNLNVLFEDKL